MTKGGNKSRAAGSRSRAIAIALVAVSSIVAGALPVAGSARAQVPPPTVPVTGLLSRFVGYVVDTSEAPIEGITVTATSWGDVVVGSDITDSLGEFVVDVTDTPPNGDGYVLTFSDPDEIYATEVAGDPYGEGGRGLFIQPGYDEVIGMTMQVAGRIAGTVSGLDPVGPIDGVCGWIYAENTQVSVCTDAAGAYDSGPIRPGTYEVGFGGGAYEYRYESGIVVAESETTVLDIQLESSVPGPTGTGSITGSFVSSDNGSAVPACFYFSGGPAYYSGCTTDGTFTTGLLPPGEYYWSISPTDGEHLSASTPCCTALVVGAEQVTVELEVPLGGSITGTVLDVDGVTPLEGVTVRACSQFFTCLWDWPGRPGVTVSGAGGTYRISGLEAGTYYVAFTGPGIEGQWWDGTPLTDPTPVTALEGIESVPVALGSTVTGIDARLSTYAPATISGTVTDSTSGLAVDRASAHLYRSTDANIRIQSVPTDSSGSFTFGDLEPGSYRVSVAAIGYLSETFDNEIIGGAYTDIVVGAGDDRSDIDFALDPQGAIEGVVTTNLPPVEWYNREYCVSARPRR